MFNIDIKWEIEKHEAILITLTILLAAIYVSEITIDSGSCSKKNPNIDCSQRGILSISQIQNMPGWVQTTGFGTHYASAINQDGTTSIAPIPEFRNGFQHAVCDLNATSTCEYHFDTYNALDIPFGTVLHLADTLTLYIGIFNEEIWQAIIWIAVFLSLYFGLRFAEHRLEH